MSSTTIHSLETRQISGYMAAASWVIVVWEVVITLDEEVGFIWSMPHTAYIKWLYLFGRYFALALQTAVLGLQVGYLGNHMASLHWCHVYRLLEMAATALLILCFDVVLLLRIYALYGRRTRPAVFAMCAVFLEFASTISSAVSTIPVTMYDTSCAMIEVAKTNLVFIIGSFGAQTILLWLAYRRRDHGVHTRQSLASITIRDGLLVFACISVFLAIALVSTLLSSFIATLAIFWIPVVPSIATARLILNLQIQPPPSNEATFTTVLLSEMPLPPTTFSETASTSTSYVP